MKKIPAGVFFELIFHPTGFLHIVNSGRAACLKVQGLWCTQQHLNYNRVCPTCSMQSSSLCRLQSLMADEGGAQEPIQRRGRSPLCVLQSCRNCLHRGVPQRCPSAPCKGGWEGLGTDEGGGMWREGKLGRWWVGVGGRGQVRGGGGGGGPMACRADAAGGKRLQESGSSGEETEEVRSKERNYATI